ncbi:hypothetical protein GJ744_000321 [Endocarpon pusillum]|uniref:Uncharacterized protein n=1 Tax=Endocarpon pusillum TaxID=364733 RepID=A0A8H7E706_9EURO|nr:hypothetical protein GJ744_000321 [Endocarpon pusillum]
MLVSSQAREKRLLPKAKLANLQTRIKSRKTTLTRASGYLVCQQVTGTPYGTELGAEIIDSSRTPLYHPLSSNALNSTKSTQNLLQNGSNKQNSSKNMPIN